MFNPFQNWSERHIGMYKSYRSKGMEPLYALASLAYDMLEISAPYMPDYEQRYQDFLGFTQRESKTIP